MEENHKQHISSQRACMLVCVCVFHSHFIVIFFSLQFKKNSKVNYRKEKFLPLFQLSRSAFGTPIASCVFFFSCFAWFCFGLHLFCSSAFASARKLEKSFHLLICLGFMKFSAFFFLRLQVGFFFLFRRQQVFNNHNVIVLPIGLCSVELAIRVEKCIVFFFALLLYNDVCLCLCFTVNTNTDYICFYFGYFTLNLSLFMFN